MQKASYRNKLIMTKKFWTRLGTDKHQILAALLTIGDVATKYILTDLKRTSKTSVYNIIGSSRNTRRGLCSLSKLINIFKVLWFLSPLTFQKMKKPTL